MFSFYMLLSDMTDKWEKRFRLDELRTSLDNFQITCFINNKTQLKYTWLLKDLIYRWAQYQQIQERMLAVEYTNEQK